MLDQLVESRNTTVRINGKVTRNREQTSLQIIHAAGVVLADCGLEKSRINTIAAHAQVNKVLIYRYFGGWNGLVKAYVEHIYTKVANSLTDCKQLPVSVDSGMDVLKTYLLGYEQFITSNPAWKNIIRWQLLNSETFLALQIREVQNKSIYQLCTKLRHFRLDISTDFCLCFFQESIS